MAFPLTIDVPEPFRTTLATGALRESADAEAATPEALFGRGLIRMALGGQRNIGARADFGQCLPELGDPCRLELALLTLQERGDANQARAAAEEIASRAAPGSRLAARAWHIAGVAQLKLSCTDGAIDSLLRAIEVYRALNDRLGLAQVYDSLGMAYTARGRLDHALGAFALSLVDKTLLDDRAGMAITLGNLGRLHLREGRFQQAIDCFERDLEISERLGDERGRARMHGDLGQAWLALEDFPKAEQEIEESLALARHNGDPRFEFLALKDRALVRMAQNRVAEAEADLDAAESLLPPGGDPSLKLITATVRGKLLAARGDSRALAQLEDAVRGFAELKLPDLEIPARIVLAEALVQAKFKAQAEQCLLAGLKLARGDGYARYLPRLNEAMTRLSIVEGALDETGRTIAAEPGVAPAPGGYIIRGRLGGGAFGEVFRAFDPQRNCEVALKRLHLERLYDVERRAKLLISARVELEAASRVRHPGVVRVLAIGAEPDGGTYITQDFIAGQSLREIMPADASAPLEQVVLCLARIADALAALHAAGVIHRDLKPENILIRPDGTPVLVDFGICRVEGFTDLAAGKVAGTLLYMAPEQAVGKRIDGRADLYALGVVAYEWLSGVVPVRPWGDSFEEMARDMASRSPEPVAEFRPQIDPPLAKLVMRLLEKKPSRRPASATAVADELRRFLRPRD